MDFISKWLTSRHKQRYLAQRYEMDAFVGKVVQLLLGTALQHGASCIVFGEPTEPHPPLDRSLLTPPEQDPEVEALKKEAEGLVGLKTKGLFSDSPVSMVPTWMKINGQWHQSEAIPLRLLHVFIFHIEGLYETEKKGIGVDDGNGKVILVDVSIRCESNFNYAIDLMPK